MATLSTAQQTIDLIREKLEAAFDAEDIDLGARMVLDDILDEAEAELS